MTAFLWVAVLQREFLGGETVRWPSNSCTSLLCVGTLVRLLATPAWGSPPGSPDDRSLCVRRKLIASRMMEALSRWELTL